MAFPDDVPLATPVMTRLESHADDGCRQTCCAMQKVPLLSLAVTYEGGSSLDERERRGESA